jgi:hypothetical protein
VANRLAKEPERNLPKWIVRLLEISRIGRNGMCSGIEYLTLASLNFVLWVAFIRVNPSVLEILNKFA